MQWCDQDTLAWQHSLQRESSLTTIPLNRLDADATYHLASHFVQQPLSPQQAAHLYAETEGIPLFIVETARAGVQDAARSTHAARPNLPPKGQSVIETRLAHLSPRARELTNVAAVIGRSFTVELLLLAADEAEHEVVRGLDELWQRRIVREQGMDAYDFSHDKIRQVAYVGLSQARRRLLHGRNGMKLKIESMKTASVLLIS